MKYKIGDTFVSKDKNIEVLAKIIETYNIIDEPHYTLIVGNSMYMESEKSLDIFFNYIEII